MRWTIKPKPDPSVVSTLQNELQVHAIIATLLAQRGITNYQEAKSFFRPNLNQLHDPFLLKNMDAAVNRIKSAITNQENILIYGDYDVDGTTAVALMSSYLKTLTKQIATYIPDRYDEGYGISIKGIDFAEDNNFSLIIALDCGIKAVDKIEYANQKNIDFIICDHHEPGEHLPNAVAILNPKQPDCPYPYKHLCGCGVGFKLIQALHKKQGKKVTDLIPYLDFVVTAIAADIVPITGENRVLAYFGLQVFNSNPRAGFKALLKKENTNPISITDIVFGIAPRINAAGRMKHGDYAVKLLTEEDTDEAIKNATEIEQLNNNRKETDKQITQEALDQITQNQEENQFTTVVYNPYWHKGVIGIVASRLIENYYRPTLVFTKSGNKLAASARSVSGFNIYHAIAACSAYIQQFGGHKYAAGLTLEEKNYPAFKTAFEKQVKNTIDKQVLTPEIKIDLKIDFSEISPKLVRILKQFGPFGPGNMAPIFYSENLQDTGYVKCVGEDNKHLRFTATQNSTIKLIGIGFNLGNKLPLIKNKKKFKAAFTVEENTWKGNHSLQLKIKDLKPE